MDKLTPTELLAEDLDAPAHSGLVKILGLGEGSTWGEVYEQIEALKKRAAEIEENIRDAVDAAIAVDGVGCSKLLEKERRWAIELGRDCGLAVLRSFLAARKPIAAGVRDLLCRADEMKAGGAPLDKIQKTINAQLRVDDATFRKHNPAKHSAAALSAEDIQREINRQVGVDEVTFQKYSH
jgi:phage I-like protein